MTSQFICALIVLSDVWLAIRVSDIKHRSNDSPCSDHGD